MPAMEPKNEGWEGGDGVHVIHECTVWFGSTRQEIVMMVAMKRFQREGL